MWKILSHRVLERKGREIRDAQPGVLRELGSIVGFCIMYVPSVRDTSHKTDREERDRDRWSLEMKAPHVTFDQTASVPSRVYPKHGNWGEILGRWTRRIMSCLLVHRCEGVDVQLEVEMGACLRRG